MSSAIPFSKKLRITIAGGALPATAIAAIGDFFSPKGGWLLPLTIGLAASVVLAMSLLLGTGAMRRLFDRIPDLRAWWEGPTFSQVGVWVLAAVSVTGLTVGLGSHSKKDTGGLLSNNLAIVADAQQVTGLLQQQVELQSRIAKATEAVQDTVKRENSDDPVKEIANLGQPWSERGFEEAIIRGDARSTALYIDGGMGLRPSHEHLVIQILHSGKFGAIPTLLERDVLPNEQSCKKAASTQFFLVEKGSKPEKIDRSVVAALKDLCGKHKESMIEMLTTYCGGSYKKEICPSAVDILRKA